MHLSVMKEVGWDADDESENPNPGSHGVKKRYRFVLDFGWGSPDGKPTPNISSKEKTTAEDDHHRHHCRTHHEDYDDDDVELTKADEKQRCYVCGKARSKHYHLLHPISPRRGAVPSLCRGCRYDRNLRIAAREYGKRNGRRRRLTRLQSDVDHCQWCVNCGIRRSDNYQEMYLSGKKMPPWAEICGKCQISEQEKAKQQLYRMYLENVEMRALERDKQRDRERGLRLPAAAVADDGDDDDEPSPCQTSRITSEQKESVRGGKGSIASPKSTSRVLSVDTAKSKESSRRKEVAIRLAEQSQEKPASHNSSTADSNHKEQLAICPAKERKASIASQSSGKAGSPCRSSNTSYRPPSVEDAPMDEDDDKPVPVKQQEPREPRHVKKKEEHQVQLDKAEKSKQPQTNPPEFQHKESRQKKIEQHKMTEQYKEAKEAQQDNQKNSSTGSEKHRERRHRREDRREQKLESKSSKSISGWNSTQIEFQSQSHDHQQKPVDVHHDSKSKIEVKIQEKVQSKTQPEVQPKTQTKVQPQPELQPKKRMGISDMYWASEQGQREQQAFASSAFLFPGFNQPDRNPSDANYDFGYGYTKTYHDHDRAQGQGQHRDHYQQHGYAHQHRDRSYYRGSPEHSSPSSGFDDDDRGFDFSFHNMAFETESGACISNGDDYFNNNGDFDKAANMKNTYDSNTNSNNMMYSHAWEVDSDEAEEIDRAHANLVTGMARVGMGW